MTGTEPVNLAGILLIDKPEGPTSMRAVERVRRAAGGVRCGHAGTLDPLATGLLVIALGPFTRMLESLMGGAKRYETVIDLTAFTTTDDREGEPTRVHPPRPPTEAEIERALEAFRGSIMQAPPAFSAVKIGGRRAYDLARRNLARPEQEPAPAPAPRGAFVHELLMRDYRWPLLALDIHCAKGFYVRSLARDLGRALRTGGHCRTIRRTFSAPFSIADAIPLDSLPGSITQSSLIQLPAPPGSA
ncbi:MAG: tRNA pseudouridine(55) synthase TruB [Phycisphaerales bacterium]|nr:tRNA pseudouridine(55) synthase TruB [Phycisphaerales bacterium]